MPPTSASRLYSPRRNMSFSRNGRSGSSTFPSSMPLPSPRAHHPLLWNPLPANRTANRTGGSEGACLGPSSPHTGTDSSHGRAIVTPTPRRNARRERGWVMRVVIARLPFGGPSLRVPVAADQSKLRATDQDLHGGREPPPVPVQPRDHLLDQHLVGERHGTTEGVAQQPPAEQL